MTSLNIQQSTQSSETVSSAVIEKLYNLAIISTVEDENSTLDVQLTGSIYANAAYETSVLYLREKFPQLTINIRDNNYYIKFADPKVEQILVASQYCSDGIGFSLNDASLMSSIPKGLFNDSVNSGIVTFDELNRFGTIGIANEAFIGNTTLTSINLSTVNIVGQGAFKNCTSLSQSINIPNLTSIGQEAFRNTNITSVTNLGSTITSLPNNCFRQCGSLTNVSVSQNITEIGTTCFCDDINLTSFDFSNIQQIGQTAFENSGISGQISIPNLTGDLKGSVFKGCVNLTSVTNLGTITSIGKDAREGYGEGPFGGCTSLSSVVIPNTVTIIGNSAFGGCTNMSQVACSWENLTIIGSAAFFNHANWNFIINLANCTNINFGAFGYKDSKIIKQLYVPKLSSTQKLSYYSNWVYFRGSFTGITTDLLYLRDIQKLYPGTFGSCSCTALVINNNTPPVWCNTGDKSDSETTQQENSKSRVFSGSTITNIYVPDAAVSTYTNDPDWSTVADKIKPLSQLTKVATEADLQQGQVALIEAYM